jgi:hypothetical protein
VHLQEFRDNSGTGNFDEHDVVETNTVERVKQGKTTLNLVCLDHALEDVANSQRLSLASKVVRNRENSTQVVGWMTP